MSPLNDEIFKAFPKNPPKLRPLAFALFPYENNTKYILNNQQHKWHSYRLMCEYSNSVNNSIIDQHMQFWTLPMYWYNIQRTN